MRCRDARALLSAQLDDELGAQHRIDAARVEQHLDGCAGCRAARDDYESLRARLRVSEPISVDLVPALRERLAGTPAPAVVTLESRARASRGTRTGWALAAAAAAVIVAIGTVAFVARKDTPVSVSTGTVPGVPELRAPDGASLLLAWTTGGLPEHALAGTRALVGVTDVTLVRGAQLRLTGARDAKGTERLSLPPGAAVPIDALAIDAAGYARDLPTKTARIVRRLPRDGALLGATSARLRGIGAGGSLTFGSTTVRVTAVVADSLVGAAEVVVRDDSPLDIPTQRFLLVAYRGDRSEIESAIGNALQRPVRTRAPGETPYLRYGDAVLPQALVKARFGEFWYRTDAQGVVTIDPGWVDRNIVTVDVPGVGRVRCHRLVADGLRRALVEAAPKNVAPPVAFDPQIVSPSAGLSRHAWGIGLTLYPPKEGVQARTIAKLASAGFTWGGLWLNKSPDYFEWIGTNAS
jgi:hypothetical protein